MIKLITVGCLVLVLAACENKTALQESSSDSKILEFNTKDKSIDTNGNIGVAFEKYKQSIYKPNDRVAELIQASNFTKSPYSNLGKFILVKGRIYKIEELPPDPNMPGKMTEVLLLTNNKNSVTGTTTIDCLCIGDTSHFDVSQDAACGGYFVGTFNSQNAIGGTVEALTIVGNIQKR